MVFGTVEENFLKISNTFRSCCVIAILVVLTLTCNAPARAGSANLWVAFDGGGGIASYTPAQLASNGTPMPINLNTYGFSSGLAFDKRHNLWAVVDSTKVVGFSVSQLINLPNMTNPTPPEILTSSSTFNSLYGCNFDHKGNLWVVDYSNNSIDEVSVAQLISGSADLTPAKVITFSHPAGPNFVTFDKAGNAWVDGESDDTIGKFSPSQLASGGPQTPTVLLSDDGSGTSLSAPGEIAFDKKGNLWVPNFSSGTVVEYAKHQLTSSGNPAPMVKLNSAVFGGPWGAAFDSKNDLAIMDYTSGTIAKFSPKQLKASGAPIPKVTVTGAPSENYQIIFGPAS
jgi:hypothetical protein